MSSHHHYQRSHRHFCSSKRSSFMYFIYSDRHSSSSYSRSPKEIRSLKESQLRNESSTPHKSSALAPKDQIQRDASLTPKLKTGYHRHQIILDDIDKDQYKLFCDEIVQIINGLNDSLQLDHIKK
ncbi:2241_t:CDS:2 [Funneliformis mosseae]|uniref:2241_t:CDS:1 n=1 Tax=Funneliformis mosseae TaxID=27381 RepID=A0A9N9GZG5_FUNMO|nr:2241_t:CDS:2 [Funneliformis mosseae]